MDCLSQGIPEVARWVPARPRVPKESRLSLPDSGYIWHILCHDIYANSLLFGAGSATYPNNRQHPGPPAQELPRPLCLVQEEVISAEPEPDTFKTGWYLRAYCLPLKRDGTPVLLPEKLGSPGDISLCSS